MLVHQVRKPISDNSLMTILNHIRTSIMTILVIATLMISSVTTLNLQQASAFGFVERQQIGDFQKLTAQFERDAGTSILEFAVENHPNNVPYGEFKKLTGQFKTDIINAVLINPPDPDKILRFLNAYDDGVERIFFGGPDTIPGLLDAYSQGVIELFELGPR
jgi:hypothetical protein